MTNPFDSDKLTAADVRKAVEKMREATKKHDLVDTDGDYRVDCATGKFFCWRHLRFE